MCRIRYINKTISAISHEAQIMPKMEVRIYENDLFTPSRVTAQLPPLLVLTYT